MKKILILIVLSCLTLCNTFVLGNTKKVYINQFVEHPALNRTTEGIIAGLKQNGYQKGVNLDLRLESAQANTILSSQIATKFVNQNADVVVGVATLSAQSFAKQARNNQTKLVFSSVTDPLQAGLVKTLKCPGNNTSGVSNFIALEPQLALFKEIQPNLKKLGFLYNPSEVNSLSLIAQLKTLCPQLGITLSLQAAHKTSEVAQAATQLANRVDAFFISNDSTALAALKPIINAANKARIPVYVSDTDAVQLGAIAALGPNQYQIGLQTASLIVRVLKGKDINQIPVEFPKEIELHLNEDAAEKIGVHFDPRLRSKATKIIKTG